MEPTEFAVYWHVKRAGMQEALAAAHEVMAAVARYPGHRDSEDERRQFKAELYCIFLSHGEDGARMVQLAAAILERLPK